MRAQNTQYEFTLTDAEGNPTRRETFGHCDARRILIFKYHFSDTQVDHALAVLHSTPKGNIFELTEFGQTDRAEYYIRAGRLKII